MFQVPQVIIEVHENFITITFVFGAFKEFQLASKRNIFMITIISKRVPKSLSSIWMINQPDFHQNSSSLTFNMKQKSWRSDTKNVVRENFILRNARSSPTSVKHSYY